MDGLFKSRLLYKVWNSENQSSPVSFTSTEFFILIYFRQCKLVVSILRQIIKQMQCQRKSYQFNTFHLCFLLKPRWLQVHSYFNVVIDIGTLNSNTCTYFSVANIWISNTYLLKLSRRDEMCIPQWG